MGVLTSLRSRFAAVFSPAQTPGTTWVPLTVREPYTGAWQENAELRVEGVLANTAVFRCVSLIATDIGKCRCRLVHLDRDGIWTEQHNPAWSPVLRRPNRYQSAQQFFEAWAICRLLYGNVYVRKARDARGVVNRLDLLDPARVRPLIAPDGAVYYELLQRNELAGVVDDPPPILEASEIIHDRWNCLFHPLVGVPPLYACSGAASQGLKIQDASTAFFANGATPAGIILIPGSPTDEQLARLKASWKDTHGGLNRGGTGYLTAGMTYSPVSQTAVDSQLTEQLHWSAQTIAGVFGVPIAMVDSSQQPPYGTGEASMLQYNAQCLQTHFTAIETSLDDGLELPLDYGTEFDVDDLIWMDMATKTKAAHDGIAAGALSPNEARAKSFGLGPVPGGDTPYLQQQYWPLAQLAARETPSAAPTPPAPPPVDEETEDDFEPEPAA